LIIFECRTDETDASAEWSSRVASCNFVAVTVLVIVFVFISSTGLKIFRRVSGLTFSIEDAVRSKDFVDAPKSNLFPEQA
jgi:hypothetical protein